MRLQSIQLYRGIVVVMIATSHAIEVLNSYGLPGLSFLRTRTGGVDFFFTLSGFIIFYAYSKHSLQKSKIKKFLFDRFLKIYPLVWFFTLISLPFYFFQIVEGSGSETNIEVIIKSLFLIPQIADPVLGATWSLSHVVFFYLIFAFYLLSPKFVKLMTIIWIFFFIVSLLPGENQLTSENIRAWKNFILSPFNLEFLLGALLAKFILSGRYGFGFFNITAGVLLFLYGWFFLDRSSTQIEITMTFCIASLLLIHGGVNIERKNIFHLPKLSHLIGNSSYAIMVVNLPIIVALAKTGSLLLSDTEINNWLSIIAVVTSVIFAVLGGIITHRFIEPLLISTTNSAKIRNL